MTRTIRGVMRFAWIGLAILCISAPPTVTGLYITLANRITNTAHDAAHRACEGQNEVRSEVVGFVDDTLTRSSRATRAALKAPASTDLQKQVARRNLKELGALSDRMHRTLKPRHCDN